MNEVENAVYTLNNVLDTKNKRHIIGGILLSISILFGGLSLTVITIKNKEE